MIRKRRYANAGIQVTSTLTIEDISPTVAKMLAHPSLFALLDK